MDACADRVGVDCTSVLNLTVVLTLGASTLLASVFDGADITTKCDRIGKGGRLPDFAAADRQRSPELSKRGGAKTSTWNGSSAGVCFSHSREFALRFEDFDLDWN